ncbi:hypothetical protein [Mucilaginibacter sp. L196]|uniref:hypothetical protein n=1 Tax=Mucilaginibacter sp. L196 TaxID=1641870 RepID=UPI00131BF468|nr:hypothetical protein [Mucilaginibacter sp. L196]
MKNLLKWLAYLKPIDKFPLLQDSFSNHVRFSIEELYNNEEFAKMASLFKTD